MGANLAKEPLNRDVLHSSQGSAKLVVHLPTTNMDVVLPARAETGVKTEEAAAYAKPVQKPKEPLPDLKGGDVQVAEKQIAKQAEQDKTNPSPTQALETKNHEEKTRQQPIHKSASRDDGVWEVFTVASGDVDKQYDMVFPLKHIPDIWQSMAPHARRTHCTHDDFRIVRAAKTTLETLKALYYMEDPGWHQVRDYVKVGMYKETESCGNTSVTMGLATYYFRLHPNKHVVVFLNCGSGGSPLFVPV